MSKRLTTLNLIALGLTSLVSQILIVRELLVAFYGNELSLAIVMGCWLFWVGMGSWAMGLHLDRFVRKNILYAITQVGIILLPLLLIFLSRNLRNLLGIGRGEIIGFLPIFYSSFILLAPLCLVLGGLFVILSRFLVESLFGEKEGVTLSYIWEAVGAGFGGLIYNFFLLHFLNPLQVYSFWASLNLVLLLTFLYYRRRDHIKIRWGGWILLWMVFFILSLKPANYLDKYSLQMRWSGMNLVESKESIYGNIAIVERENQYSLYESGLLVFSSGDKLSQEEAVHFGLLAHPNPSRVLLIGGGVGGTMEEILKHPVKEVTYVELDYNLINMAQKHISHEETKYLQDERVNLIYRDGRMYVKEMAGKKEKDRYQTIIVNLPDPYTAQLNRFYSREFFNEAKHILTEDGILCFGVTSSENYLSQELSEFLACIYKTLKELFPEIVMIPGDTNYFLASPSKAILADDWKILVKRLRERGIKTQFVNESYLPYKMSGDRMQYVRDRISSVEEARVNRDFSPIGYFYDMILWSTYFDTVTRDIIHKLKGVRFWHIVVTIVALFFLGAIFTRGLKFPVNIAIATTGFSEILFQMIVIVGFQVLYGYVYYKIGIILGSFMVGLVGGALYAKKKIREGSKERQADLFLKTQLFISLYPLILIPLFLLIEYLQRRFGLLYGIDTIFAFLPFCSGFMGGLQFPLANSIQWQGKERAARTVGTIYSIDLFGSCIGALSVAVILVPLLGIMKTCLVAGILNFAVLLLLIIGRRNYVTK